jgi:protein phosphatase
MLPITRALAPRLAGLAAGEEALPTAEGLVEALDFALWEAHRAVARAAAAESGCEGMGATAVAALVLDGVAAVCHVGDCRAYHFRSGTLRQLTRDQTLAGRLVELGQLGEEEARRHPSASQVTQALGGQHDLEPSRQALELAAGDVLLLACDGLHTQVDDRELAALVGRGGGPDELAARLVARADEAGGSDNCTVVALRLEGRA